MLLLLLTGAGEPTPVTADGRGSAGAEEEAMSGAGGWATPAAPGGWEAARGSAGASVRGLGSAGGSDE